MHVIWGSQPRRLAVRMRTYLDNHDVLRQMQELLQDELASKMRLGFGVQGVRALIYPL